MENLAANEAQPNVTHDSGQSLFVSCSGLENAYSNPNIIPINTIETGAQDNIVLNDQEHSEPHLTLVLLSTMVKS
jgi:hypothetical protein